MKIYSQLAVFGLLAISFGCKVKGETPEPEPFTLFHMDKSRCIVPCEVQFTNKSEHADTYVWDFGNGKTSTDKDVKHTYTTDGSFKVTLKATGKGGTISTSQTVEVEKAISKVVTTVVTIEQVAQNRPDGSKWDTNTDPDIFITITDVAAKTDVFTQSSALLYVDRLSIAYPLVHSLPASVNLDFDKEYSVNVFDDDGSSRELMGSVTFKMRDYTIGANAYPTRVTKQNTTTTISLNLTWSK